MGVTVSILNSKRVTINMEEHNMDKQKGQNKRLETVLLCIFGAFLAGFLIESFGFPTTFLFLFVWGTLIVVYYVAVRPIVASRLPHQNIGETPKSFLMECVRCGREIPIASEECPYCGQKN